MKKLIVYLIALLLILSACGERRVTKQGFYFDTIVNITTDKKNEKTTQGAFKKCRKLEKIFSRTDRTAELYKLNSTASFPISSELKEVITFGLGFSRMTDGAFDITVAPLVDLWSIKDRTVPPSDAEISDALKNVGYSTVSLEPLSLSGRKLDLGGLAKGYIADSLTKYFQEQNAQNIIIDLGGNVSVIGTYTVGIRSPFNSDEVYATLTLKDKSAVTSGAYQRYFEHNGKRYHHIIDARTGKCADSSVSSVTVISPTSMHADALSTAIFVLGEEGLNLCKEFKDTDAFIIKNDGTCTFTDGFEEKYNLRFKK